MKIIFKLRSFSTSTYQDIFMKIVETILSNNSFNLSDHPGSALKTTDLVQKITSTLIFIFQTFVIRF